MSCPSCGHENPVGARFCNDCGARLVTLAGRGHWIVGGRAIDAVVSEAERFLVRTLGPELMIG